MVLALRFQHLKCQAFQTIYRGDFLQKGLVLFFCIEAQVIAYAWCVKDGTGERVLSITRLRRELWAIEYFGVGMLGGETK